MPYDVRVRGSLTDRATVEKFVTQLKEAGFRVEGNIDDAISVYDGNVACYKAIAKSPKGPYVAITRSTENVKWSQ